MTTENTVLVLDLLEWLSEQPRSYTDVMDAWRTSCPRLPVWEDAVDHGFVARTLDDARVPIVELTAAGRAFLAAARPPVPGRASAR